MKRTTLFLIVAFVLAACSQSTLDPQLETLAADHSMTTLYTFQAPDLSFPPSVNIAGSQAKKVATDSGVTITVKTHSLPVDEVHGIGTYTMWVVVFNFPEYCFEGCGLDDLPITPGGDPRVEPSVLRGGNSIVSKGKGNITGRVKVGDASEALFGPGLLEGRARAAEIHFILRYHGPPISGHVHEQLHYVWGGCALANEGHPDHVPANGGFPCYDPQSGAFIP